MQESVVAKKYAAAFLNVYMSYLKPNFIDRLDNLIKLMGQHREALFYIKLSCIPDTIKKEALNKLFEQFGLEKEFGYLINLLVEHKRLFMLYQVLEYMRELYKQRNGIIECTITYSHPVSREALEEIEAFYEKKSGNTKVIYKAYTDKNLIAGIRIQSDTYLWEHSIAKQLEALKLSY